MSYWKILQCGIGLMVTISRPRMVAPIGMTEEAT